MYLFNPFKAEWIPKNRDTNYVYDDEDIKRPIKIDVIPYNQDQAIRYGIYSVPEATGYFIVRAKVDIQTGDQIIFRGKKYSVLEVMDNWVFNKLESIEVAVK